MPDQAARHQALRSDGPAKCVDLKLDRPGKQIARPRGLKQLEEQLASLDGGEAMLPTELDGFLAAEDCIWSAHPLGSSDGRP